MEWQITANYGVCLLRVRQDGRRLFCGGQVDKLRHQGTTRPTGDDPCETVYECCRCGARTPEPETDSEVRRFARAVRRRIDQGAAESA